MTEKGRTRSQTDLNTSLILAKLDKLDTLDNFNTNLVKLEESVSNLNNEWANFNANHAESMQTLTNQITTFRDEIDEVKRENKSLKDDNKALHDHINKIEAYSRRQNLIFQNIPENVDDAAGLPAKVFTIFKEMKIKDSEKIIIDEVHRINSKAKTRPIIMRFLKKSDRNKVWEARRNTPKPYILNEDLPDAYKKSRGQLMPVMRAAQAAGLKSTMVMDKIKVDGKLYGVDQLNMLPEKCDLSLGCQKENDQVVSFFGRYSFLSNFYKCSFTVDGITYNCGEQFIQQKHCECLGQDELAQRILSTSDPSIQKQLGGSIRADPRPWRDVARAEILPGIRAKFTQNPELASLLLNTGTRDIGEATTDPYWGVAMSLSNTNILKKDMWSGKNIMGKVLMTVRAELVANKVSN